MGRSVKKVRKQINVKIKIINIRLRKKKKKKRHFPSIRNLCSHLNKNSILQFHNQKIYFSCKKKKQTLLLR